MHYQRKSHRMIMVRSVTNTVKNAQLKLQNHFLEMLTATVSHDMRTPLNAILGMRASLEREIKTESGRRILRIVLISAKLLNFLVNDMIDSFRIRNDKFESNE